MCCSCASDSLQPVLKLSHIGFAAKTTLITEGQFLQVALIRPQRFAAETASLICKVPNSGLLQLGRSEFAAETALALGFVFQQISQPIASAGVQQDAKYSTLIFFHRSALIKSLIVKELLSCERSPGFDA